MRVPIYPEDLLPQAAFKKLAKTIQNRWPGRSPIQLSLAREALSWGLGYADYHNLRGASVVCPLDAETPAMRIVRAQIATSISSVLALVNDTSVPHSELEVYVDTLPLKALSTFKGPASRGAPIESEVPSEPCPPIRRRRKRLHARPLSPDVFIHTAAIKQIVENSGSLRDQSLFSLLETGLRKDVILSAKASQVISLDTYVPSNEQMAIQITKAKPPLLLENTAVVERYIKEQNLSPDDYLFPSKDRTQPMATEQLSQIFQSWVAQVIPPCPKLTTHTSRLGAMARLAASTPTSNLEIERMADQLGYDPMFMVEKYTLPDASEVNEILKP